MPPSRSATWPLRNLRATRVSATGFEFARSPFTVITIPVQLTGDGDLQQAAHAWEPSHPQPLGNEDGYGFDAGFSASISSSASVLNPPPSRPGPATSPIITIRLCVHRSWRPDGSVASVYLSDDDAVALEYADSVVDLVPALRHQLSPPLPPALPPWRVVSSLASDFPPSHSSAPLPSSATEPLLAARVVALGRFTLTGYRAALITFALLAVALLAVLVTRVTTPFPFSFPCTQRPQRIFTTRPLNLAAGITTALRAYNDVLGRYPDPDLNQGLSAMPLLIQRLARMSYDLNAEISELAVAAGIEQGLDYLQGDEIPYFADSVDGSLCSEVKDLNHDLALTFLPLSSIDWTRLPYTKEPRNLTLVSAWASHGMSAMRSLAYSLNIFYQRNRTVGIFHDGDEGLPVFLNATSLFVLEQLYDREGLKLQRMQIEACKNAADLHRMHDLLVNISAQAKAQMEDAERFGPFATTEQDREDDGSGRTRSWVSRILSHLNRRPSPSVLEEIKERRRARIASARKSAHFDLLNMTTLLPAVLRTAAAALDAHQVAQKACQSLGEFNKRLGGLLECPQMIDMRLCDGWAISEITPSGETEGSRRAVERDVYLYLDAWLDIGNALSDGWLLLASPPGCMPQIKTLPSGRRDDDALAYEQERASREPTKYPCNHYLPFYEEG